MERNRRRGIYDKITWFQPNRYFRVVFRGSYSSWIKLQNQNGCNHVAFEYNNNSEHTHIVAEWFAQRFHCQAYQEMRRLRRRMRCFPDTWINIISILITFISYFNVYVAVHICMLLWNMKSKLKDIIKIDSLWGRSHISELTKHPITLSD